MSVRLVGASRTTCDDGRMADDTVVVWDEALLAYDMGDHPSTRSGSN
ncbi:hypothetical protein V2I01_23980 [Micromonospora sp. BRA006-A]|nr:hypothetical protein [Micromonospora sp. BRA006-A]